MVVDGFIKKVLIQKILTNILIALQECSCTYALWYYITETRKCSYKELTQATLGPSSNDLR